MEVPTAMMSMGLEDMFGFSLPDDTSRKGQPVFPLFQPQSGFLHGWGRDRRLTWVTGHPDST